MSSTSIKKVTREKVFQVVLKTFEELTGHPATGKAKSRIKKKSKKLSRTLVDLLKKDARQQEKLKQATESKVKNNAKPKKSKKKVTIIN
jgi:RNase P/RNase MRP subunit POP5